MQHPPAQHRQRRLRWAVGLLLLGAALAAAAWLLRPAPVPRLLAGDAAVVARGQAVYVRECAACHGAQLEGQPEWRIRGANGLLPAPPHDASGHTWHHDDALLFRMVKFGIGRAANMPDYASAMPAYEGRLSDADIIAVLSYIKSRWPPEVRARHDALNAAAHAAH